MKRALIILGVMSAITVVAAVAGVAYFVSHPLDTMVAASRWSLKRIGAEKRTIQSPSGRLTYFVAGNGSTLVLLHGANDQAGLWSKAAEGLSRDFRLIIPDLPGHGESDPASGPLDYDMIVAGVEKVIQQETSPEKVMVAGNSMGGWIALLYAKRNPDQVSHLILEDSSGISIDYKMPSLFPRNRQEAAKVMAAVQGPGRRPLPTFVLNDLVRRTAASPMARLVKNDLTKYLLDGKLRDLRFPVTLVWGADDGILTVDYARRFAREFPNAELVTLPGCGHVPHYQCTNAFVQAVRRSVRSDAPR